MTFEIDRASAETLSNEPNPLQGTSFESRVTKVNDGHGGWDWMTELEWSDLPKLIAEVRQIIIYDNYVE